MNSDRCPGCGRRYIDLVAHMACCPHLGLQADVVKQADARGASPLDTIGRAEAQAWRDGARAGHAENVAALLETYLEAPRALPAPPDLAERVARDVGQILYDVPFGPAPEEPGRAVGDPSSYVDAMAEALRTCPHDALTVLPGYEFRCMDCDRLFTIADLRRFGRFRSVGW